MPNQTPNQRLRDIGINVEYARHVELAGQKLASLDENAVAGLLQKAEAANQQPEAVNQQPAPVHHAAPAAEQNGPHLG